MPQMAPISWLTLYMFFTMIFILFNFTNFFSSLIHHFPAKSKQPSIKMPLNWKW
uniref:ATP synthase complex subunit 8 n=1 Tax=Etrocorema hochii TaxID=2684660 RepID=A0A6B9PMS6_9NEOP|nr:ATP synthase F0 subunit 8 [Etrocorema hochii]